MESVWHAGRIQRIPRSEILLLALAGFFTASALVSPGSAITVAALGIAGFATGLPFLLKATWDALRNREVNAEVTMLISGAGALLLGQFSAASIIALMTIVMHVIEEYTTWRGSKDLAELASSTPTTALRWERDGAAKNVNVDELVPGDIVVIRQGESVPTDAMVIDGKASVVESTITGEPLPVAKEQGSFLLAGTRVVEGYLRARVDKLTNESYIQMLVREIGNNISKRPPVKRFVNVIALYFMPSVLGLTFLAFLLTRSGAAAVAMLVVASPCAILAATPLAFLATSARMAKRGVLLKNGEILRKIRKVDTVVLDKTGTVTLGRPKVETVESFGNTSREDIIAIAASCEVPSPHPIGIAIVEFATNSKANIMPPSQFQSEVGNGVVAGISGRTYCVGQSSWIRRIGIEIDARAEEALKSSHCDSGVSVVLADKDGGQAMGLIHLEDQLKDSAEKAVQDLRSLGVRDVILLTGDREDTAASVARRLNIGYRAELTPERKLELVRKLKRSGKIVAFVGDGVNDALAMAESDVAIAVAPAGSTVASAVAQVVLTRESLESVPELIRMSRKAINAIYMNIGIFLLANIGGLFLAGIGVLSPLIGAVLHGVQETFGFANSSRLAR